MRDLVAPRATGLVLRDPRVGLARGPGGETGDPPRPVSVGLLVSPRPVSPKGPENRRAVHNSQSRPARARDGGRGGPEPSVSPGSRPRRGTRGGRTPSLARLAPESGGTRGPRPARLARLAPEAGGKAGVHSRPSRPARSQKKKGQRADLRAQSRPARPLTVDAGPQTRPSRPARARDGGRGAPDPPISPGSLPRPEGVGVPDPPVSPGSLPGPGGGGGPDLPVSPGSLTEKKEAARGFTRAISPESAVEQRRADLRAPSRPTRSHTAAGTRRDTVPDSLGSLGSLRKSTTRNLARCLARHAPPMVKAGVQNSQSRPARARDGGRGGAELPVSPDSLPRVGAMRRARPLGSLGSLHFFFDRQPLGNRGPYAPCR